MRQGHVESSEITTCTLFLKHKIIPEYPLPGLYFVFFLTFSFLLLRYLWCCAALCVGGGLWFGWCTGEERVATSLCYPKSRGNLFFLCLSISCFIYLGSSSHFRWHHLPTLCWGWGCLCGHEEEYQWPNSKGNHSCFSSSLRIHYVIEFHFPFWDLLISLSSWFERNSFPNHYLISCHITFSIFKLFCK